MNLIPLEENLVVTREEANDDFPGSIIIPDTAKELSMICLVVAVGPEITTIEVDDRVIVGRYAGLEVEIDGETLLVVDKADVVAKIVKSEADEAKAT